MITDDRSKATTGHMIRQVKKRPDRYRFIERKNWGTPITAQEKLWMGTTDCNKDVLQR